MKSLPSPKFWQNKKVWLSGHTGFKGSWLALWLIHWGADVVGYSLDPEPQGTSLFELLNLSKSLIADYRADLADISLLRQSIENFQPDVVFHLAAQPLVLKSYSSPLETWQTNVLGTCHVLEALRFLSNPCSAIFITTDKVYHNNEWDYGYREDDKLGGHDPYSSSKAAAEIAIASWRSSFYDLPATQSPVSIASVRAGNVIGGGDWASNRIVPDAMRSLANHQPILVRNPRATRPWQHVLEPIGAYLLLAEKLDTTKSLATSFNIGPTLTSNRSVKCLVEEILKSWPGSWFDVSEEKLVHEASRLDLSIAKAYHQLGWSPRWDFERTVAETVHWYRSAHEGHDPRALCLKQIERYLAT